MIRLNLEPMMRLMRLKYNRKITYKELSERSGLDKNALSRIVNHPEIIPSAAVIDKLAQFFFHELKSRDPAKHRDCMKNIITMMVNVYPDEQSFWDQIPDPLKNNSSISIDTFWEIYEKLAVQVK